MVFNRLVFGLVFVGLLMAGCTQPAAPAASPASLPTVSASVPVVPTSVATAAPSASPTSVAAKIPYIASAKPTTLPSATPVSTAAPQGVPTLGEFVKSFNVATNRVFNDSRKAYESAQDIWVLDDAQAEYKYTFFIKLARARTFGGFDSVRTVYGASGVAKNVSLTEGESGPFYKYALTMKCYDARYDVEMTLYDYTHMPGTSQYRRTLGSSVMLTLADACPN